MKITDTLETITAVRRRSVQPERPLLRCMQAQGGVWTKRARCSRMLQVSNTAVWDVSDCGRALHKR